MESVMSEELIVVKRTKLAMALRVFRGFSFAALFALFISYLIYNNKYYFLYFTNWGVTLTMSFFAVANLNYFMKTLEVVENILFLVIWGCNWCITLTFWTYLFPLTPHEDLLSSTLNHTIPFLLTIIDYYLNNIPFIRKYYFIVIGVSMIYLFCILVPYSVDQSTIYTGITFTNFISYIFILTILIIYISSLELGRLIKIRFGRNNTP